MHIEINAVSKLVRESPQAPQLSVDTSPTTVPDRDVTTTIIRDQQGQVVARNSAFLLQGILNRLSALEGR